VQDLGFEREILRFLLNQDQSALSLDLDEILDDFCVSRLDKNGRFGAKLPLRANGTDD
jgi:hypothetical protein